MKVGFLVAVLALSAASLNAQETARTQVGLYFNPIVTRISISQPDSGPFAFLGTDTTSRFFGGVDIGGYADFAHERAFDAGVDIRDIIIHGNNASLNSFMVAGRIEGKPRKFDLRPYAEFAVGAGRSKGEQSSIHITKAEVSVFAGLDYALGSHVDFRAIELGYGTVSTISSATFSGGAASVPSAGLINISSGLVFRFH